MGWALIQNPTQSSSEPGKPGLAAERGGASLPSALPAFVLVRAPMWLQHVLDQDTSQSETAFCQVCLTLEQFPNPVHAGAAQTLLLARGKGELRNRSKGPGRRAAPSHSSARLG